MQSVQTQSGKAAERAQALIDELKGFPQYAGYVRDHKLALIDGRLAVFDEMLDAGVLRA